MTAVASWVRLPYVRGCSAKPSFNSERSANTFEVSGLRADKGLSVGRIVSDLLFPSIIYDLSVADATQGKADDSCQYAYVREHGQDDRS